MSEQENKVADLGNVDTAAAAPSETPTETNTQSSTSPSTDTATSEDTTSSDTSPSASAPAGDSSPTAPSSEGDTAEEAPAVQRRTQRFQQGDANSESGWINIAFTDIAEGDLVRFYDVDGDLLNVGGQTEFLAISSPDENGVKIDVDATNIDEARVFDEGDDFALELSGNLAAPAPESAPVDSGVSGELKFAAETAPVTGFTTPTPAAAPVEIAVAPAAAPLAKTGKTPLSATSSAFGALQQAAQTDLARVYVANIEAYMDTMKPGVINQLPNALRQQVTLFQTITGIANKLTTDFRPVWAALLGLFHEQREGVFHERYVNRHMDNVPLAASDLQAFQALLNLLRVTADPVGRHIAIKQVDLQRTLQHAMTDDARNKLHNFYDV